MVMAGRRAVLAGRRRRRAARLTRTILTVVVLVVAYLAISSIIKTSSSGPDAAVAYADRVRPLVDDSTLQGAALADLRGQAGKLGRMGLERSLDRLARQSKQSATDLQRIGPPRSLKDDHGLLITCLLTRSKAVSTLRAAVDGAFGSGPTDPVTDAVTDVGHSLAVADQAYRLFRDGLPAAARKTLANSAWVPNEDEWARPEVASFVATLRNTTSLAPVHDVAIVSVTTDPAPVGTDNGLDVLPTVKAIHLDVVVANAGNQEERHVAVEVVSTSAGGMDLGRQFVDLAPGQRATVGVTVHPAAGANVDLQVRVGPVGGETNTGDNQRGRQYVFR